MAEEQQRFNTMGECVCDYCIHNDDDVQCLMDQEDYGNVFDEDNCDFYEEDQEDDEREEYIVCPRCENDAYWDVDEYICDHCGWHGQNGDDAWDDEE